MSKEDPLKELFQGCFKVFKSDEQHNKNDKKPNKPNNKMFNIIVIILIGVLLVLVSDFFKSINSTKASYDDNFIQETAESYKSEELSFEEYKEKLKGELKSILQQIDGVGNVDLMIYFESGEEKIPAININDSVSVTEENDNNGGTRMINQDNDGRTIVMLNDGDTTKPLITKTNEPKITGICIVAEGADNKVTQLRINQAVVTLFNIPDDKVQVYPMK
jgi:stage III sporulation protein AG